MIKDTSSKESEDQILDKISKKEAQQTVLLTIADTTWRMFIPSVGFMLFGIFLDQKFNTTPWIMMVCVLIGFWFACILVKKQLKRIEKGE